MTFDEYRQTFEKFAKIDTPEKLVICERQYQAYLRAKDHYDFFEPLEEKRDGTELSSLYVNNLHSILDFNQIKKDQILFLIQPSFEAESLLSIEKLERSYALTYSTLHESYWVRFYHNNSITDAKVRHAKGSLKKTIGDQIFLLIERSMSEAKKSQSGRMVLDGTKFKISKIIGPQRIDIFKHSPDEDSKTGKIIQLLETVIELTRDNPSLDSEEKVESLLNLIQISK